MPILDVEIVGEDIEAGCAARIANAAGKIFASAPGQTWVKLRNLPPAQYAENEAAGPVPGPVFVSVLLRALPAPARLAEQADALAAAVAAATDRPQEHVHIFFEPAGADRVAFGGKL